MNKPPLDKKRDWLEPPDWWKQWRPLRWLAALVMVIGVLSWLQPLFSPGDSAWVEAPVRPEPRSTVVAESDGTAEEAHSEAKIENAAPSDNVPPAVTPEAVAQKAQASAPAPEPAKVVPSAAEKPAAAGDKRAEVSAEVVPAPAPAQQQVTAPASDPPPAVAPAPEPEAVTEAETEQALPAAEIESDAELETLEAQESRDYRTFTERQPNPVRLMAQFKSYSSVDSVYTALVAEKYEPIQESNHAHVRSGVPPRDLDLLRVKAFRHLGVEGILELQFFNDRLYQADFEPGNAEAYQSALRKAVPQLPRERSGRSEFSEGPLRVASSVDLAVSEVGAALRTRPFVLWQDTRLMEQRDVWDRRFAVKP